MTPLRRIALSLLVTALAGSPAFAQRPSTLEMSCAAATALVAERGAAVLSTGRFTYERFVADRRYCERDQVAERAFAPTRDARLCRIGSVCRQRQRLLRTD